MKSGTIENAIIVKSKTRLEKLTEKFNTQQQAKFYISQNTLNFYTKKSAPKLRKKTSINQLNDIVQQKEEEVQQPIIHKDDAFLEYEQEHDAFYRSLETVQKKVSEYLKVKIIDRSFLPNYIFSENDLVIVVGQDGLVANTAKYVNNIPIIGINPDTSRFDGILLPFTPYTFENPLIDVLNSNYVSKNVTMAEAKLSDGQKLLAFNDLFIGPSTHISARYKITYNSFTERQSSSGIIVSTGAGSTGWLSSLYNMANGISKFIQGKPVNDSNTAFSWDEEKLIFVVREPFLSKYSKINLSAGEINTSNELILESLMPENGLIFSDGIESDFIKFNSGTIASIGISDAKAKLVINKMNK